MSCSWVTSARTVA